MKQFSFLSKSLSPGLQLFFRPMLLFSLGLHSLFLLTPLSSEPKPEAEPEATPEEETVNISSLVAPPSEPTAKPSPKPTPKATQPTPQPSPKQVAPAPPPPPPQRTAPPPPPLEKAKQEQPEEPQQQEQQEEKPKNEPLQQEEKPEEQQEAQNETNGQLEADNLADEQLEDENLVDEQLEDENLAMAAESSGRGLIQELSPRIRKDLVENSSNSPETIDEVLASKPYSEIAAEQRDYFFQGESQLKQGAIGSLGISQRNPTTSYFSYIEPVLTNELGFEIEELGEVYGDAKLYKAKNAQDIEFYMSLVPFGSFGSQTFVVIWAADPRSTE